MGERAKNTVSLVSIVSNEVQARAGRNGNSRWSLWRLISALDESQQVILRSNDSRDRFNALTFRSIKADAAKNDQP